MVVPVAADYLAVETLRATLEGIRAVERDRGSRYRPLAVLPTMVQVRRPGSKAAAALVRERFGDLVLPDDIPQSARFDSSALAGVPVTAREPSSRPAQAYREAARAVLAQLGEPPAKRKGAVKDFVRADMRSALQALRRGNASSAAAPPVARVHPTHRAPPNDLRLVVSCPGTPHTIVGVASRGTPWTSPSCGFAT